MSDDDRIAAFREELAQLELQAPSDATDRRYLVLATALLVAAVAAIGVGWWAASGTAYVNEQIPYVISAGLLAVVLAVIGGAVFARYSMSRYLRFWLIRLVYEQRTQTDRIVDAIREANGTGSAAGRAQQSQQQQ